VIAPPTILLVDDDSQFRRSLRVGLTSYGYVVAEAGSVAACLEVAERTKPALVLLDLSLPDGDGLSVLGALRGETKRPVIVISARGREGDKITALDAGADDYLTKPFGTGELMARIRVAMRHAPPNDDVLVAGDIRIHQPRHEVTVAGRLVHLTPLEFKILVELARQPGRVLTHRELLRDVWGPTCVDNAHYLRVHIASLRRKIEDDPAAPRWLLTETGVGYRLAD
jgi:two-component system KDP operon response regulator KdpE